MKFLKFPNFSGWKDFEPQETIILALGFFTVGVGVIALIGGIASIFL